MSEQQQPHLEVFSRNRISHSTVILGVVPVTLFSGMLIYALWQFLFWIAIGVLVLLLVGALYLVALLFVDIYQRWLHAPYIHVSEQNGMFNTKAGRMYPLALPPPIVVTEEEDEDMQRAKVLLCYDTGMHLKEIEKTTGVKYWKIQKWTSEYAAKKANR